MISHLQGKIIFRGGNFLILEVGGVGYKVFLSEKTLTEIPKNREDLGLFTSLYLREETTELYGFLNAEELELFETLKGISGIGPRTALDLSSFGSLEKLKKALEKEDFYRKVKGIGKKKMQKIILEVTGKIRELTLPSASKAGKEISPGDEVLESLISLGFPRQKVKQVLELLPKEIEDSEKRIKAALKILGRSLT